MELFEEKLCEVECEGVRYILRRNPERAKELADNREGKLSKLRALLNKRNLYLAEHPGARVEVAQRDVEEEARRLKIDEWVKAVSNGRTLELVVDEVVKKEAAELDGCYVIKTDLPGKAATAELVHDGIKIWPRLSQPFGPLRVVIWRSDRPLCEQKQAPEVMCLW
jgi:hypothetical protein